MSIKPIPAALLRDGFVLLTPTQSGFSRTYIENVRIVCKSAVSDHTATRMRDISQLVVYFDCEQSYPAETEFYAGQQAEYRGALYELLTAELFSGEQPHHYKLTFQKISGGAYGN